MTEETTLPYKWSQTLQDVTVDIKVPENKKARDFEIKIEKEHISVKLKATGEFIVNGDLHKPIKPKDSFWSKDEDVITMELHKVNKMEWWSCVCNGDPEIDTTKIQPENTNLADLDGETRGMVQKMMFDQRQKAAGLPTSEELEKQEAINKFMQAHPEMDFSNAKINL